MRTSPSTPNPRRTRPAAMRERLHRSVDSQLLAEEHADTERLAWALRSHHRQVTPAIEEVLRWVV